LREPELIEMGGCFRVNMYRNTEIAKESMNTATSSEDTLQNDASNEKVRDKFGINEEIRNKFGINEEVRKNYGETAANILCLMLEKPENTLDSIANTLGVTRRTVEKQVKKLKEVGIVSRVGSNKSGSWKVDIKEDRQL
jgi:ATP-dependent DNA helicase RecG